MPIPIVDSAVGSWEQYPDYVQACRVIPSAGDPTSYTPAHPPRAGPTDITDFKVGMARWNESNLPRIMYQLWPCKEWQRFKDSPKPPQMKDAQGNLMVEHSPWPREAPRAMLDFPILKGMNKISTTVPWWFIEALMRLDPRLEWKDIDMRMERVGSKNVTGRSKAQFVNSNLNNFCSRGREKFSLVSWREKSKGEGKENGIRDKVLKKLTQSQLDNNTTRGTTPGVGFNGSVIPLPKRRNARNARTAAPAKRRKAAPIRPANRRINDEDSEPSDLDEEIVSNDEDEVDEEDDVDEMPRAAQRTLGKRKPEVKNTVDDETESEIDEGIVPNKRQRRVPEEEEVDKTVPRVTGYGGLFMPKMGISPEMLAQASNQFISGGYYYAQQRFQRPGFVGEVKRNRARRQAPHASSFAVAQNPPIYDFIGQPNSGYPHNGFVAPPPHYGAAPDVVNPNHPAAVVDVNEPNPFLVGLDPTLDFHGNNFSELDLPGNHQIFAPPPFPAFQGNNDDGQQPFENIDLTPEQQAFVDGGLEVDFDFENGEDEEAQSVESEEESVAGPSQEPIIQAPHEDRDLVETPPSKESLMAEEPHREVREISAQPSPKLKGKQKAREQRSASIDQTLGSPSTAKEPLAQPSHNRQSEEKAVFKPELVFKEPATMVDPLPFDDYQSYADNFDEGEQQLYFQSAHNGIDFNEVPTPAARGEYAPLGISLGEFIENIDKAQETSPWSPHRVDLNNPVLTAADYEEWEL